MDSSAIVALITFFAGVGLTPLMKKWDGFLNSKRHLENLFIEIDDCCSYLEGVIKSHFEFLHSLSTLTDSESKLTQKIPVPIVEKYDTQFINAFYGEVLKLLNPAQRNTIRTIENSLFVLVDQSEQLINDVQSIDTYNPRVVRNIISKSCYLYYHLHRMKTEKERYVGSSSLNSFDSMKHVLRAFGYTEDFINEAKPFKTMLTQEQIDSLSTNNTHCVIG
ncbi:hypothetical protein [Aeromonas media]|uniref:hypothetical protein n=1 Tax=Aeromonas media TaxID=651 RepID=UPI001119FE2C|nr:hypothetical protein [Aeromonas media]